MKPALSGLGGQRRKIRVNWPDLNSSPYSQPAPLLVPAGHGPPTPSSRLEGELSPASRPECGPWSPQQEPPLPVFSTTCSQQRPADGAGPPSTLENSASAALGCSHCPSASLKARRGEEGSLGSSQPEEAPAVPAPGSQRKRRGIAENAQSGATGRHWARRGRGPHPQGRAGSSSWKKAQKRLRWRLRTPGRGHRCDRRRRLMATSAQGWGGLPSATAAALFP